MPGKMARSDPRPSVRVTRGAGSGQHLASVLQEGRENANIDGGLGFIWRISVQMTIKLGALLGLIVLVPVGINAQEGMTLTVGGLEYTNHDYIHQNISVKNDTSRLVRDVKVECGFFNKSERIATGFVYVENIFPGTTEFRTIIESSDISPLRGVPHATPRVHHASRWRGGGLAACGKCAAAGGARDRLSRSRFA